MDGGRRHRQAGGRDLDDRATPSRLRHHIKCWVYTDPDAERVRAAIVEAAIEQARAGPGL